MKIHWKENGLNIITVALFITCLFLNFSQLPFFIQNSLLQYVSYIPFSALIFLSFTLGKKTKRLPSIIVKVLLMLSAFLLTLGINAVFFQGNYFESPLFFYIIFSVFVLVLGYFIGINFNSNSIDILTAVFSSSVFLVGLVIFFEYLLGQDVLSTTEYAYASKNSISQIIVTGLLISLFLVRKIKIKLYRYAYLALVSFNVIILFLLRSRASLLAFFVALGIFFFTYIKSNKTRFYVLLGLGLLSLVFGTDQNLYDALVNRILLRTGPSSSLDDMSSGRIGIVEYFLYLYSESIWLGLGKVYFDCQPILSLVQFGLLPGIFMLVLQLYVFLYIYAQRKRSQYWFLLYLIAVSFFINALFEGYAPFGPGVKCYFLWLFFGLLLAQKQLSSKTVHWYEQSFFHEEKVIPCKTIALK